MLGGFPALTTDWGAHPPTVDSVDGTGPPGHPGIFSLQSKAFWIGSHDARREKYSRCLRWSPQKGRNVTIRPIWKTTGLIHVKIRTPYGCYAKNEVTQNEVFFWGRKRLSLLLIRLLCFFWWKNELDDGVTCVLWFAALHVYSWNETLRHFNEIDASQPV